MQLCPHYGWYLALQDLGYFAGSSEILPALTSCTALPKGPLGFYLALAPSRKLTASPALRSKRANFSLDTVVGRIPQDSLTVVVAVFLPLRSLPSHQPRAGLLWQEPWG